MSNESLPPVVFLHGWGSSAERTWGRSALYRRLRQIGRVVQLIDLPGHGQGGGSHDPADYADLTEQTARRLPTGPMDLVGFSLGAKLALWMAAADPGRFMTIVAGGVGKNIFTPEKGAAIAQALLADLDDDQPEVLRGILREARASGGDVEAMAAVIRRPSAPPAAHEFNAITASVLIIAGSLDTVAGDPTPLRAVIRDSTSRVIPGVGHTDLPSNSEFARLTRTFLIANARPFTREEVKGRTG